MSNISQLFFFLLISLCTLPSPTYASWSSYRGNSQSTGVATVPGPDNPTVKWRFSGDEKIYMFQAPIVDDDGTVYVIKMGFNLKRSNRIYALNPDGSLKWQRDSLIIFDTTEMAHSNKGILYLNESFSGLMRGEGTRGTFIVALSDRDGRELWRHQIDEGYTQFWTPSITTDKRGRVYVGTYDRLAVFEPDGTKVWSYKVNRGGKISGNDVVTPTLSNDEKTVYFIRKGGPFYALNAETGKVVWIKQNVFSTETAPPVVAPDDTIFVVSGAGDYVYAFDKKGEILWKKQIIIKEDGSQPASLQDSSLALGGLNTLIINTMNSLKRVGRLVALDRSTGDVKWSYKLGERIFNTSGPVVDTRGVIYAPYGNGKVYMFSPSGEKLKEVLVGTPVSDPSENESPVVENGAQMYNTGISLVKEGIYLIVGDANQEAGTLFLVGEK